MSERAEKKLAQIAKIEKRLAKWEALRNLEGFLKRDGRWMEYWLTNNPQCTKQDYIDAFYPNYLKDVDYEIKHAVEELKNAKATLEKINRNEAQKRIDEDIICNLPSAINEFMKETIKAWNTYDVTMRNEILEAKKNVTTRKEYREVVMKYGTHMELTHKSYEDINNDNTKSAFALILNLYKRVTDITGEITDARGLRVTMGNNGYAVINGNIIGKEGRAVVESIGAGGYNIQRWHVRTLVKAY